MIRRPSCNKILKIILRFFHGRIPIDVAGSWASATPTRSGKDQGRRSNVAISNRIPACLSQLSRGDVTCSGGAHECH